MTNPLRRIWAEGGCVLNSFLSLPSGFSAEIMAGLGFDALTVDLQHGLADANGAIAMFQAVQGRPVAPMARVPANDAAAIGRVLDGGAVGVICPLVNTAPEATRFVAACRYPPQGGRSYGPARAVLAHGADYATAAAEEIVTFAMIETAEAMQNLDAIAATPGLDALYIGPADLTLGLTGRRHRIGFDREEPEMVQAILRIRDAAHAAGLRVALHCGGPDYARRARDWGFDMVTLSGDSRFLAEAARASVARFRDGGQ
ncbi:HpcH/HpaI aldolase/citrate lyase family protein [Paracoccus yeei]|uniref:HpcH/HpaI aldolase family protein n=1 Tax=Paracoccus yeei TaxID=147645 RepID=UPI0028D797E0|nr:aldolase/citrate lyase family protein [Paracoccus yeei]